MCWPLTIVPRQSSGVGALRVYTEVAPGEFVQPDTEHQRWGKERAFFDAEESDCGPVSALTIERYMACRKPYLPAEYPFWALGDVHGKRILELGCGAGGNAIILALKGAQVVGIDISARAIDVARTRARIHGVEDLVEFHAEAAESFVKQSPGRFDLIVGFAILHHLLPALNEVMRDLKKAGRENAGYLFVEPVSLSRALRRLRLALPIPLHGTPDERPLEPEDLAIMRRYLPDLQMRLSGFLLRVWHRFVGGRYEDYSSWRTALYDGLGRIDSVALRMPGLRVLGSYAVIHSGLLVGEKAQRRPMAPAGHPRTRAAAAG